MLIAGLRGLTAAGGLPTADPGDARALTVDSYDAEGNVYRTQTFSINQSSGISGLTDAEVLALDNLQTDTFYDHDGNVLATFAPSGQVSKYAYDGANRVISQYITDGGAANNSDVSLKDWTDANSVSNDVVLNETDYTYDSDGNVILTTTRNRFDNAPQTGVGSTGPLSDPSVSPSSALAAYSFSEGTGTTSADISGNGHTATLDGGTSWTSSGHAGEGLSFNGSSDYVDLGTPSITGSFTLSIWVKFSASTASQRILCNRDSSTDYGFDLLSNDSGNGGISLYTHGSTGSATLVSPAESTFDGNWHHIAATYDATTGTAVIYLDGVAIETGTLPTPGSSSSHLLLGNFTYSVNRYLHGSADELQIYNKALSAASIAALANEQPAARVYYIADYYDAADRQTDEVNVGTNGGSAYTRPGSVPSRSSTVLVTHTDYDSAGNVLDTIDPLDIMTQYAYDMLGRKTQEIDASSGGSPATGMSVTNSSYDGDNHLISLTAYEPDGSGSNSQTTDYIYGIGTTAGTDLFSNDLLAKIIYPDPSTGEATDTAADEVLYTYDLQGKLLTKQDQNGTVHAYSYDILQRLIWDTVTAFGTGVDGTVDTLGYTYNALGLLYQATSYYHDTDGFGDYFLHTFNQVEDLYNGLGQLVTEYTEPNNQAVNTSTSPKVQYVYSSTSLGSRLTEIIYPDDYTLHYGYNSGLDSDIGRLSFLADDDGSGGIGTHIDEYSYLGLSTVVTDNRPQEGDELTYVHQTGDTLNGSDGGDRYTGLDRFGRVVDQWWLDPSTSTTISRFQYGYDDDGNVVYKNDLVTSSNSELYSYDDLNRLTSYEVGTLNSGHTGITGTPSDTWTATLDGVGDRNSVTVNGTETDSSFNSQNEQTGYGSATLAYDNAGDMTTDQNGNALTYDAWGRFHAQDSDPYTDYFYDALGRRISSDGTEQLIYDQNGQVLEDRHITTTGSSVTVNTLEDNVWGPSYVNQLVLQDHYDASTETTTRTYAMQDANYNVVVITDDSGTVVDRFAYDQDGNIRSGTPSSDGWVYLWQGMRQVTIGSGSTATPLYESMTRFYNPGLGTWISPDPAQYVDGMNYYEMEMGDPTALRDPLGLCTAGQKYITNVDVLVIPWNLNPQVEEAKDFGIEFLGGLDKFEKVVGFVEDLNAAATADEWWDLFEHGAENLLDMPKPDAEKMARNLRSKLDHMRGEEGGWTVYTRVHYRVCSCHHLLFGLIHWNSWGDGTEEWQQYTQRGNIDNSTYDDATAGYIAGQAAVNEIKEKWENDNVPN